MLPKEISEVFAADAEKLAKEHAAPLKVQVGDRAALFELPNAVGKKISLKDLLDKGAIVLTFYRGAWCPYCNLALSDYQAILPQIKDLGANLVAISPQTPDHSLNMQQKNALEFEVLSDAGNKVAKQYTTVFANPETSVQAAKKLGLDATSYYENKMVEIPVPAVFIIDKSGSVIFAKSEGGDFRYRVEPKEILEALSKVHTT
jgi:peroxiredoxin